MGRYSKVKRAAESMPDYPGRAQWEALLRPLIEPVAARASGHVVQRCLGFWVLWHAYGGNLSTLVEAGVISRSGAYGQRADFVAVFGVNVEDFLPELGQLLTTSTAAETLGHAPKSNR